MHDHRQLDTKARARRDPGAGFWTIDVDYLLPYRFHDLHRQNNVRKYLNEDQYSETIIITVLNGERSQLVHKDVITSFSSAREKFEKSIRFRYRATFCDDIEDMLDQIKDKSIDSLGFYLYSGLQWSQSLSILTEKEKRNLKSNNRGVYFPTICDQFDNLVSDGSYLDYLDDCVAITEYCRISFRVPLNAKTLIKYYGQVYDEIPRPSNSLFAGGTVLYPMDISNYPSNHFSE